MANRHMKKCSYSLVIREMQIKTTICYQYICTRMVNMKKKNIYICISQVLAKMYSNSKSHLTTLDNSSALTTKAQHVQPSSPTQRCFPSRNAHELTCTKAKCKTVLSNNSQNSQNLERPELPSVVEWRKKL